MLLFIIISIFLFMSPVIGLVLGIIVAFKLASIHIDIIDKKDRSISGPISMIIFPIYIIFGGIFGLYFLPSIIAIIFFKLKSLCYC